VHSPKQVAQIAGSIRSFGFNNPILVDKDNVVVAGHGRLMAAKDLGIARCPFFV
jgi:ParB-like chromosome segregation protein Spo0J